MAQTLLRLDDLYAELSRSFVQANLDLAAMPTTPNTEPGEPPFSYRVPYQSQYELRTIPYSQFHSTHGYRLQELQLRLRGYVTTRRFGRELQTILLLQRPSWWQQIHRRHSPVSLEILIHEGRLDASLGADAAEPPWRDGPNWVLLLSQEQQAQFVRHLVRRSLRHRLGNFWQRLFLRPGR